VLFWLVFPYGYEGDIVLASFPGDVVIASFSCAYVILDRFPYD